MARGRPHGRTKSDHWVCQAACFARAAGYRDRISITAEKQEALIAASNAQANAEPPVRRKRAPKSLGVKAEPRATRHHPEPITAVHPSAQESLQSALLGCLMNLQQKVRSELKKGNEVRLHLLLLRPARKLVLSTLQESSSHAILGLPAPIVMSAGDLQVVYMVLSG
jgi:hypothetical protein